MNPKSPLGLLRRQAGYTSLEKAAKALGVSRIHLAQVENGIGGASESLAGALAQLYGVPLEDIRKHLDAARKSYFEAKLQTLPDSEVEPI